MNFTIAAVKNNRITFLILLVLAIAGVNSYRTMPRSEDPGFIMRTALIITHFPGPAPSASSNW